MSFKFVRWPFPAGPARPVDRPHPHLLDPGFARNPRRYIAQASVAAVVMLAILAFTDSISDAALAAGFGSSVIITFVHPSSRYVSVRSICGGHLLALCIGTGFSFLFFDSPAAELLAATPLIQDAGLAAALGVLILAMALTDAEHPPAAGTVLAMATRPWNPETVLVIIAAAAFLVGFRHLMRHRLDDLI